MRFEDAYEEFKLYAAKRHKKQCFDTITQNFKKHVLPYFKEKNIYDLTLKNVIYWQNEIYSFNFSNNYNKNLYCAFNSFLNYCVLNSYIQSNFLRIIGSFKKKVEIHAYDTYNYFDFKKFRRGLTELIYKYYFDLIYFYGLRMSEAMALKFSDLEHNMLHVGTSIQRGGKRAIDSPKTANSDRYLKLNFFMRLKLFILKCYYIKIYGNDSNDYFIFGGKKPLSPTTLKRYKHKACVNSNVREIKIHEFRHSYATRMIKKGVPIEIVSRNLGHSSVAITLDIYVHHEKKRNKSLFLQFDFFNTITQNFKKIIQSIITRFIV